MFSAVATEGVSYMFARNNNRSNERPAGRLIFQQMNYDTASTLLWWQHDGGLEVGGRGRLLIQDEVDEVGDVVNGDLAVGIHIGGGVAVKAAQENVDERDHIVNIDLIVAVHVSF